METTVLNYEKILIKGEPYLKGSPELIAKPMYGLNVGDRITQVGTGGGRVSGNITSSARIDHFTFWAEYAGTYVMGEFECMAFKLAPGEVFDLENGQLADGDFYKLYTLFSDGDLIVSNFDNLTTRLYRGRFLMHKEAKA